MSSSFNYVLLLAIVFFLPLVAADLRVGFYQSSCPRAETIVSQLVQQQFKLDPTITPALLRMHFHDCFVTGCDASILIDTTSQNQAEKDGGPNQTVRGFEFIDKIKQDLENACPSTVSCADVITLATRDAVAISGGPNYTITTGRRDSLVSRISDTSILPGPTSTVSEALQVFTSKGLNIKDMVTLLGAHTVGVAHCSFFQDRLPNDPSMDPNLAATLNRLCASANDPKTFLDQGTPMAFDNAYFKQLTLKRGIMMIDQELATDRLSSGFVSGFAGNATGFKQDFANAMVKLGSVQVLVGNAGQIRKNCRLVNKPTSITSPPPPPRTPAPKPAPPPPRTPTPKPAPPPPPRTPTPKPAPPSPRTPTSKAAPPPPRTPAPKPKTPAPSKQPPKKKPSPKKPAPPKNNQKKKKPSPKKSAGSKKHVKGQKKKKPAHN